MNNQLKIFATGFIVCASIFGYLTRLNPTDEISKMFCGLFGALTLFFFSLAFMTYGSQKSK